MVVPEQVADRLLVECLGRPLAHEALGRLCAEVGGRTSGADSGMRAEDWARACLEAWSVPGVRTESVPVQVWRRGDLAVECLTPQGWSMRALAHGNSPVLADVTAPVVDVGHGEPAQFAARSGSVAGALALCDEDKSELQRHPLHRSEKVRLAAEHGAVGCLIMSAASGGLPRTGVCYTGPAPIPSVGVSSEDGLRLRSLLRAGEAPTARVRMTNALADGTARNVLAEIPGTDADAGYVLLGAHLDSWDVGQGATDNGLGSAIVLEAARALASLDERPRAGLRFALWAAEEVGLCGSTHHAARNADDLPRCRAVMNFDMTGDPYGYWTPGHAEPGPLLRALVGQLGPLGMTDTYAHGARLHSDHQPFMLAGVPCVGLLARLGPDGARYYHTVYDTFEKVALAPMCRAAAVAAHTAWAIADAPEPPLPHLSPAEVASAIDAAGLRAALVAEGYDGPAMRA